MSTDNNTLVAEKSTATKSIKSASASVIGANVIIQAYINAVTSTPDINLSSITFSDADKHVITDLPKHQELARKNAESYINGANSVNSLIISTLSDIIGYANMFESRYSRLVSLANDLNSGNNRKTFQDGLKGLINTITDKENNCATVITKIGNFKNLIAVDERNLQGDENIIKVTLNGIAGKGGQIDQLQKRIDADNSALNKDYGMIAGGAAMEVTGILMITVGVLAEFETAGLSTALVVGGVAAVGGGVAMQVVAGKDISKKMDDLSDTMAKLQKDEIAFSSLSQASKSVTLMIDNISKAETALTSLQSGWSSLKGDLQQVVDALDTAKGDEGSWLIDDLNASKSDWDDAKELAVKLQANGTLKVEHKNYTKKS